MGKQTDMRAQVLALTVSVSGHGQTESAGQLSPIQPAPRTMGNATPAPPTIDRKGLLSKVVAKKKFVTYFPLEHQMIE